MRSAIGVLLISCVLAPGFGSGAAAQVRVIPRFPVRGRRNPYGSRNRTNRGRMPNANRRSANRANANRPQGVKHERGPSEIDLASEVESLKQRHATFAPNLPRDMQRMDKTILPTLDLLPKIAEHAYLLTIEEYRRLSGVEQNRLRDVMTGLSSLSDSDRQRFVETATRDFTALAGTDELLKKARSTPHETCFKLKDSLDHLDAPPPAAAPAPGKRAGKAPGEAGGEGAREAGGEGAREAGGEGAREAGGDARAPKSKVRSGGPS